MKFSHKERQIYYNSNFKIDQNVDLQPSISFVRIYVIEIELNFALGHCTPIVTKRQGQAMNK